MQASGKGSHTAVPLQVIFLTEVPSAQIYPLMHLICQIESGTGPRRPSAPFTNVCLLMVRKGTASVQNIAKHDTK